MNANSIFLIDVNGLVRGTKLEAISGNGNFTRKPEHVPHGINIPQVAGHTLCC